MIGYVLSSDRNGSFATQDAPLLVSGHQSIRGTKATMTILVNAYNKNNLENYVNYREP